MSLPSVQMPETPDIKLPTITKPDLKLPAMPKLDFNLPSTPDVKFEIPKFESMPKLPSLQAPGMPKLPQTADMPSFEAPKDMPKLSLPSISVPSFGGGKEPEADLGLEPQEVRDERARDARNIFLDYDKVAKVSCILSLVADILCASCVSDANSVLEINRIWSDKPGRLGIRRMTRRRSHRDLRMRPVRLDGEERFCVSVRLASAIRSDCLNIREFLSLFVGVPLGCPLLDAKLAEPSEPVTSTKLLRFITCKVSNYEQGCFELNASRRKNDAFDIN